MDGVDLLGTRVGLGYCSPHPPCPIQLQCPGAEFARATCCCAKSDLVNHYWGCMVQGLSRYDAIAKINKTMHYDNLGKCGHLTFTGNPLQQATQASAPQTHLPCGPKNPHINGNEQCAEVMTCSQPEICFSLYLGIYVCVCRCVCLHAYIYICVCICICICTCIYALMFSHHAYSVHFHVCNSFSHGLISIPIAFRYEE